MRGILRRLTFGALLAIVLVFCLALFSRRLGIYTVASDSMLPVLGKGDVVVSWRTNDVQTGDIVTYRASAGTLLTHRISRFDASRDIVTTKGDGNDSADPPLRSRQIYGRVIGSISGVGSLQQRLNQYLYLLLIVFIPTSLGIWYEVQRYVDSKQQYSGRLS